VAVPHELYSFVPCSTPTHGRISKSVTPLTYLQARYGVGAIGPLMPAGDRYRVGTISPPTHVSRCPVRSRSDRAPHASR
jgi:hypothetical protein